MAFLTFKHRGAFWRKTSAVAVRKIKTINILGYKKTISQERYVKKGKVIIIQGGTGTGKTRELEKFFRKAEQVFHENGVYISVAESIENWYKRVGLTNEELKGKRQFEKNQLMIEKLKGKIVFMDDIDQVKNSKVKLEEVKWIIRVAKRIICTCKDANRIHDAIRQEIYNKLKLKQWETMKDFIIDLGNNEVEVKDIGMVVAILMIVFAAITWGISEALIGALALRYISREGNKN
jgi:hypothetical protein